MTNFSNVGDFHRKFGLATSDKGQAGPREITEDLYEFRVKFMQEELDEFKKGWENKSHAEMFDALIDLVYVAMGTAHLFGYPWVEGWMEVQAANMEKERATPTTLGPRQSEWDVVKPPQWQPPRIQEILEVYGFEVSG